MGSSLATTTSAFTPPLPATDCRLGGDCQFTIPLSWVWATRGPQRLGDRRRFSWSSMGSFRRSPPIANCTLYKGGRWGGVDRSFMCADVRELREIRAKNDGVATWKIKT